MANLNLRYGFTPDPYPIRVSDKDSTRQIDLYVTISQPGPAVPVHSIMIEIPVGADADYALSARSLPKPKYDETGLWTIAIDEHNTSMVVITPRKKKSPNDNVTENVTTTIDFVLPEIRVNETRGIVAITITEFSPTLLKDSYTYKLEKLEADFPIKRFYADDPVLHDLDLATTLRWECTDEGEKKYSYRIRTDDASADEGYGWMPRECLKSQVCYSCADGSLGVQTPQLAQNTTFALDVIKPDALGHLEIHKTLLLTVRVEVPYFSATARLVRLVGQYLVLRWRAFNASRVTVRLNDDVIDHNAPADTYLDGYKVTLPGDAPRGRLHLTAHARSGNAVAYYGSFPDVATPNPAQLGDRQANAVWSITPNCVAIAANKNVALLASSDGQWRVIDLVVRTVPYVGNYDSAGGVQAAAISPDGRLAVFCDGFNIRAWDVDSRNMVWSVGAACDGMLMSPDGQFLITTTSCDVVLINLANRERIGNPIRAPYDIYQCGQRMLTIAVTPDSRLALVGKAYGPIFSGQPLPDYLTVLNLAERRAEDKKIPITGYQVSQVAIAPDGKLALATVYKDTSDNALMFIDIPSRTVTQTIPLNTSVAPPAGNMAIGDSYAFILVKRTTNAVEEIGAVRRHENGRDVWVAVMQEVMKDSHTVDVIDLAQKKIITSIDAGPEANVLAVSRDNSSVIVGNAQGVLII